MPVIQPFEFYGQTPYELHFTYDIDAEHSGEFNVQIPEPNVIDTEALLSFIAAVDAAPGWAFSIGFIQASGSQRIDP